MAFRRRGNRRGFKKRVASHKKRNYVTIRRGGIRL